MARWQGGKMTLPNIFDTVNQGLSGVYGSVGQMGQNPIVGILDHQEKAFLRFLNDPTWMI